MPWGASLDSWFSCPGSCWWSCAVSAPLSGSPTGPASQTDQVNPAFLLSTTLLLLLPPPLLSVFFLLHVLLSALPCGCHRMTVPADCLQRHAMLFLLCFPCFVFSSTFHSRPTCGQSLQWSSVWSGAQSCAVCQFGCVTEHSQTATD